MVSYNPHITGEYNTFYTLNNPRVFSNAFFIADLLNIVDAGRVCRELSGIIENSTRRWLGSSRVTPSS